MDSNTHGMKNTDRASSMSRAGCPVMMCVYRAVWAGLGA